MKSAPATTNVCELFKYARSQWVSRPQVAAELGIHETTAYRLVDELAANGMLRQRRATRVGRRGGKPPLVYSLTPEWGGTAPLQPTGD